MNAKAARSAQRVHCHVPQAAFRRNSVPFIAVHVKIFALLDFALLTTLYREVGARRAVCVSPALPVGAPGEGIVSMAFGFSRDAGILCYNSATVRAMPALVALFCYARRQVMAKRRAMCTPA